MDLSTSPSGAMQPSGIPQVLPIHVFPHVLAANRALALALYCDRQFFGTLSIAVTDIAKMSRGGITGTGESFPLTTGQAG